MDKPQFISVDADVVLAETIARYEQLTGKTLRDAHPERLMINTMAYRETLIRQGIQDASVQMLVDFSTAPVLDYLGALVGVTRLAPNPASCTITVTLVDGHVGVTIPGGTRVATADGKAVFVIPADETVAAGVNSVDVDAEAVDPGSIGNGYVAGTVKNILDPQAFIETAINSTTTSGGSDEETDENVRKRIKLAPSSFSNAGSINAYKFFALTASADIIDVAVVTPVGGLVELYPLMADGELPTAPILAAVESACNPENVRPLTDTVTAVAPTKITYDIDVDLDVYASADQTDVVDQVVAILTDFAQVKRLRMGLDITRVQIIGEIMKVSGIYNVTINTPAADIVVDQAEYAYASTIVAAIGNVIDEAP